MSISFQVGTQRIRFAGKTDVGQVRALNEDSILVPKDLALAIVSDGMGGHACGEVASALAVETIESFYRGNHEIAAPTWPLRVPQIDVERDRVAAAIKLANSRIYRAGREDPNKKGMGCTVDSLYVNQGRCFIGHVGDSRVYRLRGGQLGLVTEDHSMLNDYRRMKEMSDEEIANFRHKNVVVRALGLGEEVGVDVIVEEALVGDRYLLCSDGLNDMIDDQAIAEILRQDKRLDAIAQQLVDAANEAGGKDNISALIVTIDKA